MSSKFQIRISGRTKKEETIIPIDGGKIEILVAGVHSRITIGLIQTIDNRLMAQASLTSSGIPISIPLSIGGPVGKPRDPFVPKKPDARSHYRGKNALVKSAR
jgi:hypothetical protein